MRNEDNVQERREANARIGAMRLRNSPSAVTSTLTQQEDSNKNEAERRELERIKLAEESKKLSDQRELHYKKSSEEARRLGF